MQHYRVCLKLESKRNLHVIRAGLPVKPLVLCLSANHVAKRLVSSAQVSVNMISKSSSANISVTGAGLNSALHHQFTHFQIRHAPTVQWYSMIKQDPLEMNAWFVSGNSAENAQ